MERSCSSADEMAAEDVSDIVRIRLILIRRMWSGSSFISNGLILVQLRSTLWIVEAGLLIGGSWVV